MSNKTRNFVFTNWNLNSATVFNLHSDKIKYLAFGEEECPSTAKQHHQGYLTFFNPRGSTPKVLNEIGKMFILKEGDVHCNIQPMYGSLASNERYCSKQSALTELGEPPTQGQRKDLIQLRDQIIHGKSVDDICIENPIMFHQYGRTMERIETIMLRRQKRSWMTKGFWFYGPTAIGKSYEAFKEFDYKSHYLKCNEDKWWDGYKGQDIVLLNEFRGQICLSSLLELVDEYPLTVPVRNKEPVPFLARVVIVTSAKHPTECYHNCNEKFDQIYRRFNILTRTSQSAEWVAQENPYV